MFHFFLRTPMGLSLYINNSFQVMWFGISTWKTN